MPKKNGDPPGGIAVLGEETATVIDRRYIDYLER